MTKTASGYDLAVIGSGGAAFAAAIAAQRAGKRVLMVERHTIGGTCVNTGCVPSKALLAAAEARHVALDQRFPGITTSAGPVDFPALIAGKRGLVEALRAEKYTDLAEEYGWQILRGEARFVEGPALEVTLAEGGIRRVEAAHYLVATGSAPWTPPIDGLAEVGYLTSTTAMELDALPESLLVVGGNAIGLEQAQLFARLGTSVTVVEALDRLAPFEEPEISQTIEGVFADEGVTVHTGAELARVRRRDGQVVATVRHQDGGEIELSAEQLLVATGRRPATAGLNLEAVQVKVGSHGEVVVDEYLRTTNPRIWAVGDVTGHPQYVYVAAAHGTLAADNALNDARRVLDYTALPRVTFTSPAIASVGMTEAQALEAGLRCECRVLPLEYVPRALVNRDTRGLVKLVADAESGRLLGAHVIAESAGEVIAVAGYALANRMSVAQVAEMWCPYLTMAEGLKLAAQTFTRDVTKLSCCAS
ncbi:mercuric reductase [Carbonactinospora thermoautotrophica]|uniref:Mercuric reductase n=1 Tax=Carbonactinospora thermoautotrophica TaxID=1469144 RepID=A0A132N438_9ACTN|nr:mercury(II) reductase [Carbonactinospora thermoautotrophica]KWX04797.1 mercuric reductase [Carbonactinospora thermoautotrophica]KWX06809.1 mercuric reductase [Carbonactinospora thermoautotrophica]